MSQYHPIKTESETAPWHPGSGNYRGGRGAREGGGRKGGEMGTALVTASAMELNRGGRRRRFMFDSARWGEMSSFYASLRYEIIPADLLPRSWAFLTPLSLCLQPPRADRRCCFSTFRAHTIDHIPSLPTALCPSMYNDRLRPAALNCLTSSWPA